MIVSKKEFAVRRGVKPETVRAWIFRGHLKPPALRADGSIDTDIADRQLALHLDPVRAAAKRAPVSQPTAEPVPFGPAADLLRAKVLMAAIAAERARRELECQRGRYLLAEEAETAWTAQLADFLQGVEISLGDLALSLGLDHEQTTMLRKWWRRQRAEAAERCRCEAASLPEYVEDSACVGSAVTESLG